MLSALGLHHGKIDIGTLEEKALGASEGTLLFAFCVFVLSALGLHEGEINIAKLEQNSGSHQGHPYFYVLPVLSALGLHQGNTSISTLEEKLCAQARAQLFSTVVLSALAL